MIKINFKKSNFSKILEILKANKSVILPTDTSYGFSGLLNKQAVNHVEKIKNRENKAFLVLVKDLETLQNYTNVEITPEFLEYFNSNLPTTFILPKSKNIPNDYFPNFHSIGIRVPKNNQLLMEFLEYINQPIFSTSANFASKPSIYKKDEIIDSFNIFDNLCFCDSGDLEIVPNSRIFICGNNKFTQLR